LFACSQSTPIRRAVNDSAIATLSQLDGDITFTQVDGLNVKFDGKLNKGILNNDPGNYFISIGATLASFSQLGITISVPGTLPFTTQGPGDVEIIIGLKLSVLYNDNTLDSATITKN
ncbi:12879_t:CDS:1, partial [Cetraspora pellucida]